MIDNRCFKKGTFNLNALSHYPKEEGRPKHLLPFRNILYEDAYADIKTVQPNKTLEFALMTCYGFEPELMEPIAKSGVQLLILNDNSNADRRESIMRKYLNYENWTVILPGKPLAYQGAFHPKIWLLKFPNFLRVVIGSQNLHVGDWTVWSQAMWIQDFQLCEQQVETDFGKDLTFFIKNIMGKNMDLLKIDLSKYDFSGVEIRLLMSLPGRHTGDDLNKYGLNKISPMLPKNVDVTYQSTSVGGIDNFMKDFKGLKLIYPTSDYIQNHTHGGVDFANPLFLKKDYYKGDKFPKQILHQFLGSDHYYWHTGIIPHLKVMIATDGTKEINDDTVIYIGSHNLSQAAWGRREKKDTQIYITNTELGVVYPAGKDTAEEKKAIIQKLPFQYPPKKYEVGQQPWIAEVYYEQLA